MRRPQGSWGERMVSGRARRAPLAAVIALGLTVALAGAVVWAAGTLDGSFSENGKLTTDFGGSDEDGRGVAVIGNRKIVVAGRSNAAGDLDFAVARYRRNGHLDRSFSGNGKQRTDFGGSDTANDVAIQQDGRIVVVGYSDAAGSEDFAAARYKRRGGLDTSFSGDGRQTIDFTVGDEQGSAVEIQEDGKIVVAGRVGAAGTPDFLLARLDADGSPDFSFSTDGQQTTDFGGSDYGNDVAIQENDGRLVVAGVSDVDGDNDFALARYDTNGSLDTSFSTEGLQTAELGGSDTANDVAIQEDGRIIAVGSQAAADFALARFDAGGSLDMSFSDDGTKTSDFGGGFEVGTGVALQPADGKILVAGESNADGSRDFGLARYRADGLLDTSFSGDGVRRTGFGADVGDGARDLAIHPNGKPVLVGFRFFGQGDFALARFTK